MNTHPHAAFLAELKIAIDKFVPMTPPELIKKAKQTHAALMENEATTAEEIHDAMVEIGREEYPYRKAYHDLCDHDEEKRLKKLVFERIDESVRKKVEEVTQYNVLLDDYVSSEMFENGLTGEERYQVTNAITMAEEVLEKQCDERASDRATKYEDLLAAREKEAKEMQEKIDILKKLAEVHPEHADEIKVVVFRLEEGWSITEPDVSLEELDKEIEYWQTIVLEEGDAGDASFDEEG
jgi:hypothetical protein